MRPRLGLVRGVLLLFCVAVVLLLPWARRGGDDAVPLSVAFVGLTNGTRMYPGAQAVFAVTNRSSFPLLLEFGSHWYYEDGSFSHATIATNRPVLLNAREGRLVLFGGATNIPCRLALGWIPSLAEKWLKVPLTLRQQLPRPFLGVTPRYQISDWITQQALTNGPPLGR